MQVLDDPMPGRKSNRIQKELLSDKRIVLRERRSRECVIVDSTSPIGGGREENTGKRACRTQS